tara:strand:+ start:272 stop:466 length:195 start_codon:yes stop_codon:yes gene_type:complete
MSHEVNDKLLDTIYDEIIDGLDKLDDKMWEFFNDVSSEYGLHPKDDHDKIIELMVDKEFDNRSQ